MSVNFVWPGSVEPAMTEELNAMIARGREELVRRRAQRAAAEAEKRALDLAWWQACLDTASATVGPAVAPHFVFTMPSGFNSKSIQATIEVSLKGMAEVSFPMCATVSKFPVWEAPESIRVRDPKSLCLEVYPISDLCIALARAVELAAS